MLQSERVEAVFWRMPRYESKQWIIDCPANQAQIFLVTEIRSRYRSHVDDQGPHLRLHLTGPTADRAQAHQQQVAPFDCPCEVGNGGSSLHLLHQTLESSSFLVSGGIAVHSLAAAGVNSGIFSTFTMFMPLLYARSLPKAAHRSRSRLRRCQIEGLLRQSAA
jgi:hypothetical protein